MRLSFNPASRAMLRFRKPTSMLKPRRQSALWPMRKPLRPTKAAEIRETAEAKEISE
jgi:hypothetical protein